MLLFSADGESQSLFESSPQSRVQLSSEDRLGDVVVRCEDSLDDRYAQQG